jgi:membrane protein YdbS with pleckstrin-like domain
MFERALNWLLGILRVPPEPRPPASDQHVLRVFRAAPNFWRYKLVLWVLGQCAALAGLFFGFGFAGVIASRIPNDTIALLIYAAEYLAWLTFVVQLPFSFALLKLDFDMRWYILTDRSMHLREGTLHMTEKTITYANVQNISIRQNPLQRILNIADVNVRTAGGGESAPGQETGAGSMHEARFHGVGNAEEIRDAIRERVRLYRDSGLGDHDDVALPPARANSADAVLAARDVLAEVRALRGALKSG